MGIPKEAGVRSRRCLHAMSSLSALEIPDAGTGNGASRASSSEDILLDAYPYNRKKGGGG